MNVVNDDERIFKSHSYKFFDRKELHLNSIHDEGYHIMKEIVEKKSFPIAKRKLKKLKAIFSPEYTSK